LAGKGFFFDGRSHDSFVINYPRKPDCLSHETFDRIIETDWRSRDLTLRTALDRARQDLGSDAVLDFTREIVYRWECANCAKTEPAFKLLGRLTERDARCPSCGKARAAASCHTVAGDEPWLDMTFSDIGMPPFDIFGARVGCEQLFYELSGDREHVLGPVA
jgi:adenylyltransferase/sulfurtransferase